VYSTDIITSTITEKGTVTVVQYEPTPVLKSTTYESVQEITHTSTTFWTETEGSAYTETQTGSVETIGGETSGGKTDEQGGGKGDGWGGAGVAGQAGTTVRISTADPTITASASAWTHATAAAANLQATTPGGGWAGAAVGGTVTAAGVTAAGAGVAVNWNAGTLARGDVSSMIVVGWAIGLVLLFEICHYLGQV
jgi:hypothetical protein